MTQGTTKITMSMNPTSTEYLLTSPLTAVVSVSMAQERGEGREGGRVKV